MTEQPEQIVYDRQGLEVLSDDECWRLLAGTGVARLGFIQAGEPVIMPINVVVHGHRIVFRTAGGSKLSAAVMHQPVAVEIDHFDWEVPRGWSVLARGQAQPVEDPEQISVYEGLGLKPWADAIERQHWVHVIVDELSGRRIVPPRV